MSNELIIGLGGIVLSALTYFAGVWRTEKRHMKFDKSARNDAVFNRYMELRRTNTTGGFDGLQRAGVATLESDQEIRKLAARIVAHAEKDPLGGPLPILDNVDLKKFFEYAVNNKVSFFHTKIEDVVSKSQA